eukprot:CAMPEP_0178443626 /NCGR_PEP_ID=MMETSP0689_2-20121128/39009_1 /TAXON_ID=160604 /ORGANISM="Amphidinium massartii, Strain CS-259" /LENGTH=90 /DNA_ID=CAMNT_0020067673 /DNA_START=300 /DNA_END=572 /DNA_ORIENTATION=-
MGHLGVLTGALAALSLQTLAAARPFDFLQLEMDVADNLRGSLTVWQSQLSISLSRAYEFAFQSGASSLPHQVVLWGNNGVGFLPLAMIRM